MFFDLHRHDEFSFYDGSGSADSLAELAKELGYTSLGLSNHGNTCGLVRHYDACKKYGIKPIMGVETYFLPKYKEKERGYHLCLFAKDLEGYRNINRIQSEGEEQKFYNPIVDFNILEKYHDGVIATSACVAGYLGQCIIKGEFGKARKYLSKMQDIFGDDFYVEIQPYKISEEGLQEKVNIASVKLANEFGIKCILTSDSHRGRKEDIEAYIKMHELKNPDSGYLEKIRNTYSERYMPTEAEIKERFCDMHKKDFGAKVKSMADAMVKNLEEIEAKVDGDIIDKLAEMPSLPKYDKNQDSFELLKQKTICGLKERGKYNHEYISRAKEELKVIRENKFEDYFLIVQDYVNWAKSQGIAVGPGRGSGCNCLINFVLGITDTDPILFNLDYTRFIRFGKSKLPDIDLDFETSRRGEVIRYIIDKYSPNAVQIASYGMNKVDNLVNDLAKTYPGLVSNEVVVKEIKKCISKHKDEEGLIDIEGVKGDRYLNDISKDNDGFLHNFIFLYNKVKYMGTHAAGVAISNSDLSYYTAIRIDSKTGKKFSSYNLVDLERCGIIKYDILGLNTLSSLLALREEIGPDKFNVEEAMQDKQIMKEFSDGNTTGVFQFDKQGVQELLRNIGVEKFSDVIAASAMNRPGPLSLGIPSIYAESRKTWATQEIKPVYAEYVDDTFGCILYQEQVRRIAHDLGGLNWDQADKIQKMDDPNSPKCKILIDKYYDEFIEIFTTGMKKYGMTYEESKDLFDRFLNYTFNKGHATGYALISLEEMFYKTYYKTQFWFSKLKFVEKEEDYYKYCENAVRDGCVIFLPHVNYSSSRTRLRAIDGELSIQQGLSDIKGVGEKAANEIEEERKKHGIFISYDNFYDRCKSRVVTSRVVSILKEQGALEFNKRVYLNRTTKYNSSLYARSQS